MTFFSFFCSFPSQFGIFTLVLMKIATFRCIFYKIALKFFKKKSQENVPRSSQKVPRSQGKIESPKILGQVPRSGTTDYISSWSRQEHCHGQLLVLRWRCSSEWQCPFFA